MTASSGISSAARWAVPSRGSSLLRRLPGTFLRQTPPDATTRIPTPAMLAGDFSTFASPACNRGQQALRAPFANNRSIEPVQPGGDGDCAAAADDGRSMRRRPVFRDRCYDQSQIVAKADYQGSGGHSIFGRYMLTFDEWTPAWPSSGSVLTTRAEDNARRTARIRSRSAIRASSARTR